MQMRLVDMIGALITFYESVGYEDFYEREIEGQDPETIRDLYETTFENIL